MIHLFFRTKRSLPAKEKFFCLSVSLMLILCSCATLKPQDQYLEDLENIDKTPVLLYDTSEKNNVNGTMPDNIYITTLTQTFCKEFQFCVQSGRIWVKKNNAPYWSLFLKTGLPYSSYSKKSDNWFPTPSAIEEIASDEDCLIAFDDKGLMYRCYFYPLPTEKTFVWKNTFGWPDKLQLKQNALVKDKRGWGFGVRRSDVLWYEDRFGNQHHFGTMGLGTLYFLTKDGQQILFTDSGMPIDFSNSILGPQKGKFVAENISVSGSTIFLINAAGEMYTRLIDFDTMGCDPMFFKYTYKKEVQPYKGNDYRSNFTHWALPNEDWRQQPAIPLTGKARLTRFISIRQDGQGNFARSLRVAGLSYAGKTGFYYKELTDADWKFREVPLRITEANLLPLALPESQKTEEIKKQIADCYGKSQEIAYTGYVINKNERIPGVSCSISDFTLTSEGKCTLDITNGTETKHITLYSVEMWTYVVRYNPGRDGTPKNYFMTAFVDDDDLKSSDTEFSVLLTDIFGGKDKKLFAFSAEVTDSYMQIFCSDSQNRNVYSFFLTSGKTKTDLKLYPNNYKTKDIYRQPIIKRYNSEDLTLNLKKSYSVSDGLIIAQKIENNKQYIKLLEKEMNKYQKNKYETNISRWGYNAVDLIAAVTLLNQIDFPKIKTITSFGENLMNTNADNYRNLSEYRTFVYPYLIKLIELRIKSYENLLEEIKSEDGVFINSALRESYPDYFSTIGLPQRIYGYSPSAHEKACVEQTKSIPIIGCLTIFLVPEERTESLFITMPDIAEKLYKLNSNKFMTENIGKTPFETQISFYKLVDNESPLKIDAGILNLTKRTGTLEWDGTTLKIWVKTGFFSKQLLFQGCSSGEGK